MSVPVFQGSGGRICVADTKLLSVKGSGRAVCYGGSGGGGTDPVPSVSNPVLTTIPVLTGETIGGSVTFDLNAYQTASNAGTLQWRLSGAPTGMTIGSSTGIIQIEEGVAITSSDGSIVVTVENATGGSSSQPLIFAVSSYNAPSLASVPASLTYDVTTSAATYNVAAALNGQTLFMPLTWTQSTSPLPAGVTFSTGGVINVAVGTNATTTLVVRVTDAAGRFDQRSIALTATAGPPTIGSLLTTSAAAFNAAVTGAAVKITAAEFNAIRAKLVNAKVAFCSDEYYWWGQDGAASMWHSWSPIVDSNNCLRFTAGHYPVLLRGRTYGAASGRTRSIQIGATNVAEGVGIALTTDTTPVTVTQSGEEIFYVFKNPSIPVPADKLIPRVAMPYALFWVRPVSGSYYGYANQTIENWMANFSDAHPAVQIITTDTKTW